MTPRLPARNATRLEASPHLPVQEVRGMEARLARRFAVLAGLWGLAFVAVSAATLLGMSAA